MINHIKLTETILYVNNQEKSSQFYQKLFRCLPDLDTPGMTEFIISSRSKLGLMPNNGVAKILSNTMPHPNNGIGIPRCELYLYVENIEFEFENAIKIGAKLISPTATKDWGDRVCYFSDPDGHIIAFAERINNPR